MGNKSRSGLAAVSFLRFRIPLPSVISKIYRDITAIVRYSQPVKSYYAVTSQIRYYKVPTTVVELRKQDGEKQACLDVIAFTSSKERIFDFSHWKDAPHMALANLRDEPKAVLRFTRTYGVLAPDYKFGEAGTIPVGQVLEIRDELRRAWEGRTYSPFVTAFKATVWVWPNVENLRAGMAIVVENLGHLIGMMFAQDLWEGRLKKCKNPDCPAPYFRAVRKSQRFCSQKCGVLISVRHFREREAKRNANRKGKRDAKAKKARRPLLAER